MAEARFTFPRGFLWGTATSAHQVEGQNTNNNWHVWEQDGHITDGSASGDACGWWNGHWREDFDRAEETCQNAHRLSIEWSRIQPNPDRWDENALDKYRQIVRGAKERGLTPMVTLHHFTDPIWLAELGGWNSETIVPYFQEYVRKVVEGLGDFVSLWCTINEPNLLAASGYLLGVFPPGVRSIRAWYNALQNMVKAHTLAYTAIHEIQPKAQVGLAHHYRGFSPSRTWSPLDRYVTNMVSRLFNDTFPYTLKTGILKFLGKRKSFPQAKGTQDFIGINYYTREWVAFSPIKPGNFLIETSLDPDSDLSPNSFIANEPQTFFHGLKWAAGFGLPVYITENGVEDSQDTFRPKYLVQHIHNMWRGINFNWPIKGYFHWSLVDNFEWERGWSQRFGLWELDIENQTRKKRKSADLYEAICRESALSSEMVSTYAPNLFESMFPG